MKNVAIQYNSRTRTLADSLVELRSRCRKSPAFLRLLKLAASKKLRGERPDLGASNKVALRALEIAVGARERQWVITTEGQPFRTVYLQRLDKTWEEVSRHTAARVAEASTLDTFKLMNVTVFDSAISREDAQARDAQCPPDELYFAEPDVKFEEKRQRD